MTLQELIDKRIQNLRNERRQQDNKRSKSEDEFTTSDEMPLKLLIEKYQRQTGEEKMKGIPTSNDALSKYDILCLNDQIQPKEGKKQARNITNITRKTKNDMASKTKKYQQKDKYPQ